MRILFITFLFMVYGCGVTKVGHPVNPSTPIDEGKEKDHQANAPKSDLDLDAAIADSIKKRKELKERLNKQLFDNLDSSKSSSLGQLEELNENFDEGVVIGTKQIIADIPANERIAIVDSSCENQMPDTRAFEAKMRKMAEEGASSIEITREKAAFDREIDASADKYIECSLNQLLRSVSSARPTSSGDSGSTSSSSSSNTVAGAMNSETYESKAATSKAKYDAIIAAKKERMDQREQEKEERMEERRDDFNSRIDSLINGFISRTIENHSNFVSTRNDDVFFNDDDDFFDY